MPPIVFERRLDNSSYFESGFPHGPDQWISIAASNWASMALALAAPARVPMDGDAGDRMRCGHHPLP
jgi:hypothetical protein